MNDNWKRANWPLWGLALGYFACYIPYSALTKALSNGRLPGAGGGVAGFELLPATVIATSVTFLLCLALSRGWRYFHRVRLCGVEIPFPRWQTTVSGLATATIIAATTLNYTFEGVSILFALLLMRGGVLMLAPLVDRLFGRRVHWYSWTAFGLSMLAVAVALANVDGYYLSTLAIVNLSAYLLGYVFRLQFMTWIAKSEQPHANRCYLIEETFVAALALTLVPGVLALIGYGEIMQQLRTGFTTFLTGPLVLPALAIGFWYACLYYFGSRIYLDQRENTFCISLNRCSSLMSGVVASYGLTFVLGDRTPSVYNLLAAGIIVTALLALGVSSWQARRHGALIKTRLAQRVFLFVCSGNTSRSPLAAAICTAEIARRLGISLERQGIRVASAGITATPGTPLSNLAVQTLAALGIPDPGHRSRNATEAMVQEADAIYCMTAAQRDQLSGLFPHAAAKIECLDAEGDLDDPHGGGLSAYQQLAERMRSAIQRRIGEFAVA